MSQQIFVKLFGGKSISVAVEISDTIDEVVRKVEATDGVPAGQMRRLVFAGKVLDGSKTLTECNINQDDIVTLVERRPFQGA